MDRAMAGHGAQAETTLARLAAAVAAALLGAGCGGGSTVANSPSPAASGAPERPSIKIAVGGQAQLGYLPLTLADQLGFFTAEGLAVEIQDLKGGAEAVTALIGGSVEAVAGYYEQAIRGQAQGRSIEMIAVFDRYPGMVVLVNRKHADAHTIKDIAGMRIGITAVGSPSEEMIRYLFKQSGLDPNAAQTVALGSGSPAAVALRNDQVQALVAFEPAASALEQGGDGRALYDTRTAQGSKDVFGGSWPAGGLNLMTDFVKQNPRTAAALARALVRALKYLHAHPVDDVVAHLPQALFYPDGNHDAIVAALKAELGVYSADGMMPADGPIDVLQTLKAADAKTDWSTVDLQKTYDDSFVKAAANVR